MGWDGGPRQWADIEYVLTHGAPRRKTAPAEAAYVEQAPVQNTSTETMVDLTAQDSGYAELHACSHYSFLHGTSSPSELVETAVNYGISALAVTDRDGFYGAMQCAESANAHGLPTVFGAEISLGDNPHLCSEDFTVGERGSNHLVVLAKGPEGYKNLSHALTRAHMRTPGKGNPSYSLSELAQLSQGQWIVLTGADNGYLLSAMGEDNLGDARARLAVLCELFGSDNVVVELAAHGLSTQHHTWKILDSLAQEFGLATVATGAVRYAHPQGYRANCVVDAISTRNYVADIHHRLYPPSGGYLRTVAEMRQLFADYPHAVDNTVSLAKLCAFDSKLIAPDLPPWEVPDGHDEASWLSQIAREAARVRYHNFHHKTQAYAQLEAELSTIKQLGFPGYFLIVHDIVQFCERNTILCQGRGSAANSVVCFVLGVTQVEPIGAQLLFERFLSAERDGPPDIDIDIESDRREEVIQYVFDKYGRDNAAQVANVITYRSRSAMRDVARAFGYSQGQQDAWSKYVRSQARGDCTEGAPPEHVTRYAAELKHAPRHLGIHSAGMLICDRPLADVVPVEWASMQGRSVVQWDKDDCATAGLVKFDLLGLGMLSALRYCVQAVAEHTGREIKLYEINLDDTKVYDLLCAADTVGVFQVESRAQMATLPRLKPRNFYDIVVEVALIRPGPIQGGSVHPYIRRRNGEEPITYDHPALEQALQRTLGVPLFQEQLMNIATVIAGFTATEADQLRRAMGSKRSDEKMHRLKQRFFDGMRALHGIGDGAAGSETSREVGEKIWTKLCAFANYGFPESHSHSFASIVYFSAWFKVHYPAIFYMGLLQAQPMGFYSPQSLVADARRHNVLIRPVCINSSQALASCEDRGTVLRIGLASVKGISTELARHIVAIREQGGDFISLSDIARRTHVSSRQLENLSTAGAVQCFHNQRREALWAAGLAATEQKEHLPGLADFATPALPGMNDMQRVDADIWATGITVADYPIQHMRPQLAQQGITTIAGLAECEDKTVVHIAAIVTHRQRPPTAGGITFLNMEDETGMANVVCSQGLWARYRRTLTTSQALLIRGMLSNISGVISINATKATALDLGIGLRGSRDYR